MRKLRLLILFVGLLVGLGRVASASNHYTIKQMDALAQRVGGKFWINAPNGTAPLFLTAPALNATSFRPLDNESFEITELVGRAEKNPYYKVRFNTGKIAYLRPETFLEEINGRLVRSDPLADEKLRAEQSAQDEKRRLAWIKAQRWPPAVKEAAIKKQPTPGLTSGEIRQVLGPPVKISKVGGLVAPRGPTQVKEEHWYYADGRVLWFRNNILSKVEESRAK